MADERRIDVRQEDMVRARLWAVLPTDLRDLSLTETGDAVTS
jgi:hypothetical protein